MLRGQFALIIPAKTTPAGLRNVTDSLAKAKVKPLGEGKILVVPWNADSRAVLEAGVGIAGFHVDQIPKDVIAGLPESEARIAKVWNWSLESAHQHVSDAKVKRLWKSLGLEIRDNRVYDSIAKKDLGLTQQGEEREHQGNWSLWQTRGWTVIPGWFGWWEKIYCWSQTYQTSTYGGAFEAVDFISAQVMGPNHYAYESRSTSPVAYAEDWTYIWVGMTRGGQAYSYARKGTTTRQITSPNIWPRF
jgi:hypothetical protein